MDVPENLNLNQFGKEVPTTCQAFIMKKSSMGYTAGVERFTSPQPSGLCGQPVGEGGVSCDKHAALQAKANEKAAARQDQQKRRFERDRRKQEMRGSKDPDSPDKDQ